MIVVDTNVVSELMKETPDAAVLAWFNSHPRTQLFTTSITVWEIGIGITDLDPGKKRRGLEEQLTIALTQMFQDRIIDFNAAHAIRAALIVESRRIIGRPIKVGDAQIASIAAVLRAEIATRNVRDFEHLGLAIVNPWTL